MTHFSLVSLLATLARALLAGGCGEVLRLFLQYLAPGIPPLAGIAIGLVLGVTLVEIAAALWHRRAGSLPRLLCRERSSSVRRILRPPGD